MKFGALDYNSAIFIVDGTITGFRIFCGNQSTNIGFREVIAVTTIFGKWFQKFTAFKIFRNQLWLNISHLFFSFLQLPTVKKAVSEISDTGLNKNSFDMLEAMPPVNG